MSCNVTKTGIVYEKDAISVKTKLSLLARLFITFTLTFVAVRYCLLYYLMVNGSSP